MIYHTIEDYLTDDSFIQWVLQPNDELDHQWNQFIEGHTEERIKINKAKKLLLAIHAQTVSEYDYEISNEKFNKIWLNIHQLSQEPKFHTVKKLPYRTFKIAASIILLLGISYVFQQKKLKNSIDTTPIIVNAVIEAGTDKATLTLEDGAIISLEKGNNYRTNTVNSNGEEIIYETGVQSTREVAYHYLTIPKGGQFFIKLSDGTQVWLNSESKLKYPVKFIEGEAREVELVYGEAFFDVSPSIEHKGSKFEVFNKFQKVEVLGTEFNIKAYKDEANVYTTLVEGKVSVNFNNENYNLYPSQQSNFNLNNNSLIIKTVDVYNEISWKEGVFSFDGKSLEEIMKVLSRWYDMEVVFENENIKNEKFYGVLRKDHNIEKIISIIVDFGILKEYEFKDKILVLK